MVLISSCHVDDIKGAGTDAAQKLLLTTLEREFGALKTKSNHFECIGIMHEQDPKTREVWAYHQHRAQQLMPLPV